MASLVFDIEVYSNFWLCLFMDIETKKVYRFQISPNCKLDSKGLSDICSNNLIIGFNSRNFDIPQILLALDGCSCEELKKYSDDIIVRDIRSYNILKDRKIKVPKWNHIDIQEVCPLSSSLKIYGGRIHCKKLQSLPLDPNSTINKQTANQLYQYCKNDLEVTELLYKEILPEIELREKLGAQYNRDFRSSKGSQVAEGVIVSEVEKLTGKNINKPNVSSSKFKYKIPNYIKFKSPQLVDFLEKLKTNEFHTNEDGEVEMPSFIKETVMRLEYGSYKPGIGGLHSLESCVKYETLEEAKLVLEAS